jgi:hypothetical protein
VRTWFWFPVLSSCCAAPLHVAFNRLNSPARPRTFAPHPPSTPQHVSGSQSTTASGPPTQTLLNTANSTPSRPAAPQHLSSRCPALQASHPPRSLFASRVLRCVERLDVTEVYLHLFRISELMGVQRSVPRPRAPPRPTAPSTPPEDGLCASPPPAPRALDLE